MAHGRWSEVEARGVLEAWKRSGLTLEAFAKQRGIVLAHAAHLRNPSRDGVRKGEMAEEMENRFGPPPEDARRLVQLMSLETELRRLRVLGCEAHARWVTLHLREDTPLDPAKITELVRASRSPYRLTPDMRLARRFDGELNGLADAETMLAELGKCLKA